MRSLHRRIDLHFEVVYSTIISDPNANLIILKVDLLEVKKNVL